MDVGLQSMRMHMYMIKEGSPDSMSKIFYGKYMLDDKLLLSQIINEIFFIHPSLERN